MKEGEGQLLGKYNHYGSTVISKAYHLKGTESIPTAGKQYKIVFHHILTKINLSGISIGQSYKHFTLVIYDSIVVTDLKIPHITTIESYITSVKCL